MTVLVTGADRVDAGKTTFSVGLLHAIDGVGFKPRAGNDYWFDYDDYRRSIAHGRLYGKDARRLAEASAADVTPESINPVHRLWRPVPDAGAVLGRAGRSFVLDRVGEEYVVNATGEVPDSAVESLPLASAPRVASVEELNRLIHERYLPLLDELRARIDRADRAVVESYGDVAQPIRDLPVERVAVVEPGRVRIFDGGRYRRACEVATGHPGGGRLEERVPDVIGPLDPEAVVALPPLADEARRSPRRVADAYADAIETLV